MNDGIGAAGGVGGGRLGALSAFVWIIADSSADCQVNNGRTQTNFRLKVLYLAAFAIVINACLLHL